MLSRTFPTDSLSLSLSVSLTVSGGNGKKERGILKVAGSEASHEFPLGTTRGHGGGGTGEGGQATKNRKGTEAGEVGSGATFGPFLSVPETGEFKR